MENLISFYILLQNIYEGLTSFSINNHKAKHTVYCLVHKFVVLVNFT